MVVFQVSDGSISGISEKNSVVSPCLSSSLCYRLGTFLQVGLELFLRAAIFDKHIKSGIETDIVRSIIYKGRTINIV